MNVRLAVKSGPTLVPRVLYGLLSSDARNALPDLARWVSSFFRSTGTVPWLPYPTRRWLDRTLRPEMRVFEYGAGCSTLYFAERVRHVTSVEHDAAWHETTRELLAARGLGNVTLVHAPPEPSSPVEYSCESFGSASPGYERCTFERYAKVIDRVPDDSLDVVVVDGRARASCACRAWRKIRPGGFLLLDDSTRPQYACIFPRLEGDRLTFVGVKEKALGTSQSTVWQKPECESVA
jgi:SAM-dependent methyltransferase